MRYISLKSLLYSVFLGAVSTSSYAEVLSGTGSSMNFEIGYGIQVNEGSSLQREWVIVNDDNLPVSLRAFGVSTRLNERNWLYDINYDIELDAEIRAIEVRFIPFDIWGESSRTLSATTIEDLAAGQSSLSGQWRILSENDAVEHYAMLGYVAQVKLASGQILRADAEAVVEEARRFSLEFTSADLSTGE